MDITRYIIAVILGVPALFFIYVNWYIFWLGFIKKEKTPSGAPLLGGILLCIAFAIIPNNPYAWLCWVALIIDRGCLPAIIHFGIYTIKQKYKAKKDE